MTRPITFVALALFFVGCGGGAATEPAGGPTSDGTAGGETQVAGVDDHPMRTTTPVPVPQPAVAREELSQELQDVWTRIEEVVAIRPPEGPEAATEDAVQAWADGPFREWIEARTAAMQEAVAAGQGVPEDPPHERAVASALFGYALEDFVADVRGSPVPEDIATDEELLAIYMEHLTGVLRPVAVESVISYAFCQRRLAALGDDSEWLPWRAYCVQRGRDVIQTYDLEPHEMDQGGAPEQGEPEDAEDAEVVEEEPTT